MEATIRKNPRLWMFVVYLFLVAGFIYVKPSVAFGREGNVRPFGVSSRDSTIFPIWLFMFFFAVASYAIITYVVDYSL